MRIKKKYTIDELNMFEALTKDLICWMFYRPNDSFPIEETIRKAYELGKVKAGVGE